MRAERVGGPFAAAERDAAFLRRVGRERVQNAAEHVQLRRDELAARLLDQQRGLHTERNGRHVPLSQL